MKKILKKIAAFMLILATCSITISFVSPVSTNAAYIGGSSTCDTTFLGLTPWYCHVEENPQSEEALTSNVVKIASNILVDISILSAYLVLGFVIYGGYLYMFSSGDPTKAANSRKVLTRAFIGLAIVLLANVILNAIRIALIGNQSFADIQNVDANELFTNAINFAIAVAGVVCLIFIIIGAVGYITSSGDSSKLQKAKNTLTYALIGLIVVGLAAVITAFVSNLIREAGTSYINNQTIIAKELNEKLSH